MIQKYIKIDHELSFGRLFLLTAEKTVKNLSQLAPVMQPPAATQKQKKTPK